MTGLSPVLREIYQSGNAIVRETGAVPFSSGIPLDYAEALCATVAAERPELDVV